MGRIQNINCVFKFSDKIINNSETGIQMNLLFENGCKGKINLDISYIGQQKHILEFTGHNGAIFLENRTANFVDGFELRINKMGEIKRILPQNLVDVIIDKSEDPRIKIVLPIARRFIDWCNYGNNTKPNFKDGLRIQKLIEEARASIEKY